MHHSKCQISHHHQLYIIANSLKFIFTDLKVIDIPRNSVKCSITVPNFIQICVVGCHGLDVVTWNDPASNFDFK